MIMLVKQLIKLTTLITLLTIATGCHLIESAPASGGEAIKSTPVKIHSTVSNINIGNVKKTNINMFDNNQGPITVGNQADPINEPNFKFNAPIDVSSILNHGAVNSRVSIGGNKLPNEPIVDGKSALPTRLAAAAVQTLPNWSRQFNDIPSVIASANAYASLSLDHKPKGKKEKKQATAEQLELKGRLLDLAAKATNSPNFDGSVLVLNKETNRYEPVQLDPNSKMYKEKLREALDALSAKKLSAKKFKKLLGGPDSGLEAESEAALEPEAIALASATVEEPNYKFKSGHRNLFNIYNTPTKFVHHEPEPEPEPVQDPTPDSALASALELEVEDERKKMESLLGSRWGQGRLKAKPAPPVEEPSAPEESARVDEERAKLVNEVRFQLDDRINRISDLLFFRSEFLNILLAIDDTTELTPIESVFKRLILCNSNGQFCLQDLSPPNVNDEADLPGDEEIAEQLKEEEAKQEDELHLNPDWQSMHHYIPDFTRYQPAGGAAPAIENPAKRFSEHFAKLPAEPLDHTFSPVNAMAAAWSLGGSHASAIASTGH